ncbi:MAG: M20/M25/M40 family metallo-hydrolase [Actinobacteria bacterium]|nr:M20/M25/M40 family metallo-hydrolase [Actinomycetota bacterium]
MTCGDAGDDCSAVRDSRSQCTAARPTRGYAVRVVPDAPLPAEEVERIAADAALLCGIPAPTGHEGQRAQAVLERLRELGLEPASDAVGNVVCRVGPPGPALALCAHLDTVFPSLEPQPAVRDGARLGGPGVGDNALGLAALLAVARALAADPPTGPVLLVATVGEEGLGDLRGVTHLLDAEPVRALVAIEGHGVDSLAVGAVASARVRVTCSGPGGHSWSDQGRPSAIHALVSAAERILAAAPPAVANVGVIEGGTAVNAIAERASLVLDLRHVDPALVEQALGRIERAARTAPVAGIATAVEVVGRRPGGDGTVSAALVELAREARDAVGLEAAEEHPASTDANAAIGRGIPALGVGVSRGEDAHTEREWIAVPPIAYGAAALLGLVRRADERIPV